MTNAWHATSGGIATHYRSLLAEARRTGRQMVLIVPGERDSLVEDGSTRIYSLQSSPSPFNCAYRSIMPDRWPGVNSRAVEIVLREQPDLIEICDKYSLHYFAGALRKGYLPELRRRPVLIGLSCERRDDNLSVYLTRLPVGRAFARWYMKWIYFAFFDHHIAHSHHVAKELRLASRGHIRERGVWVRPPGVDLSCFTTAARPTSERSSSDRLVLYAGRLAPEKNLDLLVDAFAELCRDGEAWRLIVAGDGVERKRLSARAENLFPGRYLFLGHIADREQLAKLFASCDVFVHPNPAEPFGIAPLEAMASGLAFVGPRSGGILTYANSTNSWLAPPSPHPSPSRSVKHFHARKGKKNCLPHSRPSNAFMLTISQPNT
ncbi:MAG: glycosyltransferase [Bryobacter sp.]|jgi:alpha-1,6-mannosyltransferase|nr:glycosyltransferase [Bryobacter sp. CoA8 C33]